VLFILIQEMLKLDGLYGFVPEHLQLDAFPDPVEPLHQARLYVMLSFGSYELVHHHAHFLIIGVFDSLPPVVIVEIFRVAVSSQVDLLDLWVCPILLIHRLKTHGRVCEYPLIGPDDLEAIVKHSLVLRDLHAYNCEIPNVILELYDLLIVFRLARLLTEVLRFQDPEREWEECQLRKSEPELRDDLHCV
jgi:hypothetical protein